MRRRPDARGPNRETGLTRRLPEALMRSRHPRAWRVFPFVPQPHTLRSATSPDRVARRAIALDESIPASLKKLERDRFATPPLQTQRFFM